MSHFGLSGSVFKRAALALLGPSLFLGTNPPLMAEEDSNEPLESLPGYYQFYEKAGDLVRIPAEVARDEQIDGGKMRIKNYERPVGDFELPDARGKIIKLAGFEGKNLVITTFRTWW